MNKDDKSFKCKTYKIKMADDSRILGFIGAMILCSSPFLSYKITLSIGDNIFKEGDSEAIILIFFALGFLAIIAFIALVLLKIFPYVCDKVFEGRVNKIIHTVNNKYLVHNFKSINFKDKRIDGWRRKTIPEQLTVEVLLPNDKHLEYLKNQMTDTNKRMYDIVKASEILGKEDKEELTAFGNQAFDMINHFMEFRRFGLNSKYPYEKLMGCSNSGNVLKPLTEHLLSLGLRNVAMGKVERESFNEKANEILEMMTSVINQYKSDEKGSIGEDIVNDHLEMYSDTITNYSNIRFEVDGESVETDNIVVGENGIFALEVKNYGNEKQIIRISRDGQWQRFSGSRQIPMKNVMEQHNRHIAYMQKSINRELKDMGYTVPYIFIVPMIVFANDDVALENESDTIIIRTSNIYNNIRNHKTEISLSSEIQSAIGEIINKNKKELKSYAVTSYKEAIVSKFENLINEYEEYCIVEQMFNDYIENIFDLGYDLTEVYISIGMSGRGIRLLNIDKTNLTSNLND